MLAPSEAYLAAVPAPVKPALVGYTKYEQQLMLEIAVRFGLTWPMPAEVHDADMRICVDEKAQNMAPGLMWGIDNLEPLGVIVECWSPTEAERQFLKTFRELTA